MAGEAHVIVGCGGSGIRTLRRLNELLSQDYYWRRRLENDIYYVLVDTDIDEMREFEEAVKSDLRGIPDKPFITVVPLSKGETHLQPLVYRHMMQPFAGGKNEEGRKRLLEHWWNRGADDPFIAPNVTRLTEGAGQCPPVSYFLTWMNLKKLEESFRKLIEAIQKRKNGFGRYDELNFLVVAGLAGGTGRGSWELVAFKLRELFGKHGVPPNPRAFLYDSSIFQDVFQRYPEQRTAMQVNALTGVSQLSCWLANKKAGHTNRKSVFSYHLPSLTTPENPATDVLTVDLDLDVNNAAPVNHAYLVFDQNEIAHLANHYQYYEMVGAGIYAALSKSSILRQAINSGFPYVGLATATYEVNAATLRRYFEAQARFQATKMLTHLNEKLVDEKVAEFFKQTHLRIDVTDADPSTFYRPDPKGLFIQKVQAKLETKSTQRLGGIEGALEEDNVDETTRLVRSALVKDETLVQTCFKEAVADEKLDPYATAERLAKELFEQSKSITDVRLFIEKVQAGLEEELNEMPTEMSQRREDPVKMVEEFAKRPFPVFYRFFNEGEQKKLMEVMRRALPRAQYPALKQELETAYKHWWRQIDRLKANAGDLIGALQKLEQKFARERDKSVAEGENAFELLFTDPNEPEKGLDQRFSAKKFYRRELKPVLGKGEDLTLLEGQVELAKELFTVAFETLLQDRDFSETEAFDVRKRLESRVEQAILNTVGLQDEFITDHFSIRKVIGKLIAAWRTRLRKKLSFDVRATLEERFEEFFGFKPKRVNDGKEIDYDFPEIEQFILNMAASLARTCKPYWTLNRGQGKDFKVALFVPTEMDREAACESVSRYLDDESIKVEVYAEQQTADQSDSTTANPFIILAYSTQGSDVVDEIKSLGYHTEPEVVNLLKEAEDDGGRTVFEGARNGGIGFVDPLYVRNERIRELRWRPWFSNDTVGQREERNALDALLYALFPGDTKGSAPLEKLQASLQGIGWKMPLIVNQGKNRFELTRLPLEFVNGKVRTDQQTQDLGGWDAGKAVAPKAGLHNVYQVLLGVGEAANPAWRKRILQESETFWGAVFQQLNLARGMPAFRELLDEYAKWLGEMSRSVKDDEDRSKEIWNKLLGRLKEFTEM